MEQRTLDVINIVKGNTKYYSCCGNSDMIEAIKHYLADECAYNADWYMANDIFDVMYDVMRDYLDYCDKPSFFMWRLKEVVMRDSDNFSLRIAIALSLVQVFDENGNYVNGFDDRLHNLDY